MAVNDVVNGISAANTILDYQPASGVEVVITAISPETASNLTMRLYNGTIDCILRSSYAGFLQDTTNMKAFINNTNYLRIDALGGSANSAYTGIQTK